MCFNDSVADRPLWKDVDHFEGESRYYVAAVDFRRIGKDDRINSRGINCYCAPFGVYNPDGSASSGEILADFFLDFVKAVARRDDLDSEIGSSQTVSIGFSYIGHTIGPDKCDIRSTHRIGVAAENKARVSREDFTKPMLVDIGGKWI